MSQNGIYSSFILQKTITEKRSWVSAHDLWIHRSFHCVCFNTIHLQWYWSKYNGKRPVYSYKNNYRSERIRVANARTKVIILCKSRWDLVTLQWFYAVRAFWKRMFCTVNRISCCEWFTHKEESFSLIGVIHIWFPTKAHTFSCTWKTASDELTLCLGLRNWDMYTATFMHELRNGLRVRITN